MSNNAIYSRTDIGNKAIEGGHELKNPDLLPYLLCFDDHSTIDQLKIICNSNGVNTESIVTELLAEDLIHLVSAAVPEVKNS